MIPSVSDSVFLLGTVTNQCQPYKGLPLVFRPLNGQLQPTSLAICFNSLPVEFVQDRAVGVPKATDAWHFSRVFVQTIRKVAFFINAYGVMCLPVRRTCSVFRAEVPLVPYSRILSHPPSSGCDTTKVANANFHHSLEIVSWRYIVRSPV